MGSPQGFGMGIPHLSHDGVPGVPALHDAGLHKVPHAVVAAAARQDGQAGGAPGVLQPLLDPGKALGTGEHWVWGLRV